jgi:ArsR family transcriptional regulator
MFLTKQLLDEINRVSGKQRVYTNGGKPKLSDQNLILLNTARKDNEIKRDRPNMASSCEFTAALLARPSPAPAQHARPVPETDHTPTRHFESYPFSSEPNLLRICICVYSTIRIYLIKMNDALRRFKSEIFQGLANPTRIAIVEALRDGELSAGTLIEKLGIEQANASQHLAVLRAKQIVVNRKVGNQVFYSIRDHALIEVLDILRHYFYSQLSITVDMMKEVARQEAQSRVGTPR